MRTQGLTISQQALLPAEPCLQAHTTYFCVQDKDSCSNSRFGRAPSESVTDNGTVDIKEMMQGLMFVKHRNPLYKALLSIFRGRHVDNSTFHKGRGLGSGEVAWIA